ncbi:hypothetical protein ZIOFF_052733 [Zingiber officinale]|uniref:Arginine biosynthesis bifunctional protein ArgJ, chloroplastic n=1 Tax=Zingiber officinale TaxID=94328 RepID=A0A8J5FT34_ZINOF|nr:hypothetical protein ZIOFF_052733 [Zingiber officinale]
MALVPLNHLLSSPAALVHRIRVSEFGGIRTRRVSIPMAVASTYIPAAPILLPEGPWTEIPGGVTAPKGFKAAGIYGGLRAKGNKPDLSLVTCEVDAAVAGSFTTNLVTAAPVIYCKNVLDASTTARAILINAGQANAATGDLGYQDAVECANALAELLNMRPEDVLLQSTGVIGQRIKKASISCNFTMPFLVHFQDLLLHYHQLLMDSTKGFSDTVIPSKYKADSAAIAITTTDLVSKSVAVETEVGGVPVRVGGMAKGSGMINPNMATMLGVVTTDAGISSDVWKSMVRMSVDRSFNQITVDGDTSTNDCVLALASGLSGSNLISSLKSNEALQLQACLDAVMQGLAKSIAWDGEGATCLIEVSVIGATGETEAAKIAHSVASSSLVKAAIYGRDPNWGRIACAVGYAGVHFDLNDLMISLGDIPLMRNGQPLPFDRDIASKYLRVAGESHGTVHIYVSVGNGEGSGKAWGCDLSYDYVKINAEYTT